MHSPASSTVSSSQSLHYDDLSDTSLGTASSITLHSAQEFYPKNALDDRLFSPQLPKVLNNLDKHSEDIDSLQNSSTPDLRSRSSSSSSLSGPDIQLLKTPPQDAFVTSLSKKLEALINAGRLDYDRVKPRYTDYSSDFDATEFFENGSYYRSNSRGSSQSDVYSTPKVEARPALKRKRRGSNSSHDAELESNASFSSDRKAIPHPSDPNPKKAKKTSFSYAAARTASERRAQGLSASASLASASDLVATEPVSPVNSSHISSLCSNTRVIVAAPDFSSIPRPPLNSDDAAEKRLIILLQKEEERRHLDGFERGVNLIFDKKITQEEVDSFLGIDESFRRKVIQWMLYVSCIALRQCHL